MAEELGWGAGGFQAFQGYEQQAQLLQEGQIKLEDEKVTLAKSKIELKQQQTFMDLLEQHAKQKQMGGGTPPAIDPTQQRVSELNEFADLYIESGQLEKGTEVMAHASTIASQHSEIVNRTETDNRNKWGTVANLLDTVHDQASWDQAKAMFQHMHPDWANTKDTQGIFETPYSEKFIDTIKRSANTQIEQADLRAKQAAAQASTAAKEQNEARAKLDKAQEDNYRDLIKHRDKVGGGNLTAKPADVKLIADLAKDYFDEPHNVADPEFAAKVSNRSQAPAERMLELQRQGMPRYAAARKAFNESVQHGDWPNFRVPKATPGSFASPLALPISKNPNDLTDGKYYLTKDGHVARWDKAKGKLVLPPVEQPAVGE